VGRITYNVNRDGSRTITRHLSWSVNKFFNLIHKFIHSFWGVSGGGLGVVGDGGGC
jgi:hypothetical protein